ncbi:tyrosine-type recombinase/integrase [Microlunatus elymi]|uniref:tyrosine-type recombinase/integrase n=1 Tax=Microlunatus elymi TaxID=2596828 RepID=UPI00143D2F8C|nr:site-specific integrase [Microlunatus elymi]
MVRKLRELRRELDAGVSAPSDRLTTGAFLDRWVLSLDGRVSAKTADSYADTVRLHLVPGLGRIPVRKLIVSQVDALWQSKRQQGYSANSIRIMRSVLRRALTQAEREGVILRNVAALSGAPRLDAGEGRSMSVDQARELLDTIKTHRHRALISIMLAFGLRRGEALGLHWSAFDADAMTLRVTHGVKRVKDRTESKRKTRLEIGELKTRRSRRTLFLTPELVELLKQHRGRQAAERIAAGAAWQDHGLVFPTEIGTPLDPDNFSHVFARLTTKAGLGHWHPHELRHSGASLMLAQGTDLYVVSEVLGHASIAITKDIYGHLVEGHKREASKAMSTALFGTVGSQSGSQGGA